MKPVKIYSARIGRSLAELLLVFVGVYAALWLSDFQQRQEQARPRDQILASLGRNLQERVEITGKQATEADQRARESPAALEQEQRPQLRRFTFITDYNPGDIATLLQSGGLELLYVNHV